MRCYSVIENKVYKGIQLETFSGSDYEYTALSLGARGNCNFQAIIAANDDSYSWLHGTKRIMRCDIGASLSGKPKLIREKNDLNLDTYVVYIKASQVDIDRFTSVIAYGRNDNREEWLVTVSKDTELIVNGKKVVYP